MKWLRHQFVDNSCVKPEQRFVNGKFYLNCAAGCLSFKPKNVKELNEFRDRFINRFQHIADTTWDERAFFDLYEDIRDSYGFWQTSYKANVRTRFRGRVFRLYSKVLG